MRRSLRRTGGAGLTGRGVELHVVEIVRLRRHLELQGHDSFAVFALLYLTAIYLEFSEKWTYPLATALLGLSLAFVLLTGITRLRFLCVLAGVTAHVVVVQLPDVANHVNLFTFLNVLLIAGLVSGLVGRHATATDETWYESVRPVLQTTMVLVYVLAGFHKLNSDFFDIDVSCVGQTTGLMRRAARATIGGLPVLALASVPLAGIVWLLTARASHVVRLGLAVAALAGTLVSLTVIGSDIPPLASVRRAATVPLAVVIVVWEIVGGLALTVASLQLPMLLFSWTMHASLALVNFVDFGALVVAMFYNFIPRPHQRLINADAVVPGSRRGSVPVSRPTLYVAVCLVAGLISPRSRLGAGLVFNAAVIVLIWPVVRARFIDTHWPEWSGVPIRFVGTPQWMRFAPLLLILHASTSYLGLRTAGNFSMFSNLRTEGEHSNHFLLARNPLKVWAYQEDVVHVLAIDDATTAIGYQYQPLEGHSLPAVEFRKLVYLWTRAGRTVPMEFEYAGERFTTEDITRDARWAARTWDWEMQLLDFRVVQSDSPNRCRW